MTSQAPTRPVTATVAGRSRRGTVRALLFLVSSMPLGIVWFTTLLTLLVVGATTVLVWVGIPLLLLTLVMTMAVGAVERGRANALLGTRIAAPQRQLPTGFLRALRARLRDGHTWRDMGYALLMLPVGVVEFVLVVGFWGVGLELAALPLYRWALPEGTWLLPVGAIGDPDGPHWLVARSLPETLLVAAGGLVLCGLAWVLTRGLARAHARLATALLAPVRPGGSHERGY